MCHLLANDAVKLGSLHSALRRAVGTLPNLQPSVVLDVSLIRGSARTRGERAAEHTRQRRGDSFSAFRIAHRGVMINAVTVRMALPSVLPRNVGRDAVFAIYWLPVRSLRRLCVKTSTLASGLAQVSTTRDGVRGGHCMPCGWCLLAARFWLC